MPESFEPANLEAAVDEEFIEVVKLIDQPALPERITEQIRCFCRRWSGPEWDRRLFAEHFDEGVCANATLLCARKMESEQAEQLVKVCVLLARASRKGVTPYKDELRAALIKYLHLRGYDVAERVRRDSVETFDATYQPSRERRESTTPNGPTVHSPDYRSVRWFGEPYTFTATQAACIKVFWENWQQGTPEVAEKTVVDLAESAQTRLDHVFDKGAHPAWGTMIVRGSTKGTFRLSDRTAKPTAKPTGKPTPTPTS